MWQTKAANEGEESEVGCCCERVFIFAVLSDMKERNYLASNNKVNGLIIEEAWRSREPPPPPPLVTDACVWFGWRREWAWQYQRTCDSPYSDGGGGLVGRTGAGGVGGVISLPWDVFMGPAGCQSFWPPVTCGAHLLFISCCCSVCARGRDYE